MILTLRNQTIHKCDLSNFCNVFEIDNALVLLRDDNAQCRVEHYPQHPSIAYDETCKLCLVDSSYCIHGTTNVTSYCSELMENIIL